jgi:hypothetical protein
MGDRGNIVIRYEDGSDIYFYSHWGGTELPRTLAEALNSTAGRARWNDEPYLARIIFDHVTGLEGGETGYGISPYLTDNEHPILLVNVNAQRVERHNGDGVGTPEKTWTFEEFIAEQLNS